MNLVILMGRLTKEPDITTTQSGTAIARYSIAVDRKFKKDGEPDADFFNCVSFGKQATFVANYLHKGTKIVVNGTIQNNEYTNKEGIKTRTTQILVSDVEFAESKGNKTESKPNNDFLNVAAGVCEEELPFS
jgi:single-strand DNA-binding protein